MKLQDCVVRLVDTETTGLDYKNDRICEVAYADFIPDGSGEMLGKMSWMINPGKPIPPEASAINHITDVMVATAPTLDKVLPEIMSASFFAAHHAEFDMAFLDPDGRVPKDHVLCTKRLAKHTWPSLDKHSNQYLRYLFQIKTPEGEAHRAMSDVLVTVGVVSTAIRLLRSIHDIEDIEQLIALSHLPIFQPTMKFGKKHYGEEWPKVPLSYLSWMRDNVTDLDLDTAHALRTELERRRL